MSSTSVILLTQMSYALRLWQTMYKSKLESKVGTPLPKSQAGRKTHKFQLPLR
jgi:hypothetical protein